MVFVVNNHSILKQKVEIIRRTRSAILQKCFYSFIYLKKMQVKL